MTLRELEAAATPGPWLGDRLHVLSDRDVWVCSAYFDGEQPGVGVGPQLANLDLIAAARNALPLLLDVVDAVREHSEGKAWPLIRNDPSAAADGYRHYCKVDGKPWPCKYGAALARLDSEPLP